MKYRVLLKANCKSQKGSLAGICALLLIISLSLCAVLSIWRTAKAYEEQRIDESGFGDIAWWTVQVPDMDELLREIEKLDDVESAWSEDFIHVSHIFIGDEEITYGMDVLTRQELYMYQIYRDDLTGLVNEPAKLSPGEVYVVPTFCSLYDAEIGDAIVFEIAEGERLSYTIKGFFEDPAGGSSMMGIKNVLMSEGDMEELSRRVTEMSPPDKAYTGEIVHIFQKSDIPVSKFQKLLGEETALGQYSQYCYTKITIMGFMLILQDIVSGFLLVFVAVLFVVAMIIVGHSISSSIEQEYVNMGILKAVGFTAAALRRLLLVQYLLVIVIGMGLGTLLSPLAIRAVNGLTVMVIGLMIPVDMPVGIVLPALLFIFLVFVAFISAKTVKIGRITPIRAIRGGAEDVYFASRLMGPVHKKAFGFWIAYRQLISGKKQYISACLIAGLLVFFLSLTYRMDVWIGEDGEGLMASFGATAYDFGVDWQDDTAQAEAEKEIAALSGIVDSYRMRMLRGSASGVEYLLYISDRPEYYNLLEGRTCKYDNETLLTEAVAKELGVWTGDKITVSLEGKEEEFIISGIYQCANDMGANFAIGMEGYLRLGGNEDDSFTTCYLLEDSGKKEEIIDMLEGNYGGSINDIDDNGWSGLDSILMALSALEVFMYVITIIAIVITVALMGSKILYKEQHDLGVYKSLGFGSNKLRFFFALRFIIVAAVGSVLGVIASALFTDSLAELILSICGISRFQSALSLPQMVLPAVIVSGLFLAFAYLAAGKIKKTSPGILIVE